MLNYIFYIHKSKQFSTSNKVENMIGNKKAMVGIVAVAGIAVGVAVAAFALGIDPVATITNAVPLPIPGTPPH